MEGTSDGGWSNRRLFLPATEFNRIAVTREINDGLMQPRFASTTRAWLLSGTLVTVQNPVDSSIPQDADNR
ncbi:hypothetical protein HC028_24880 [Planosporangium flavigriseum]|uniref:Uncharacterized protein n=1 Tax=Planosporangium flavigriseum TaxID=373681 RepID=A0A8J3PNG9_9ACTN|nr:hypothetical protein [Planosporangium flavigriseum]NJC67715.1 hypothetical protein [Planosporangium flavigriseum]GIG75992.1 hypothetical protein Pfl04_43960 [Planosporangium flavigriseum]